MRLEAHAGNAWLTALAAVTTAELVTDWTGRDARIKWPNDVRVEGRKIAGILVERRSPPRTSLVRTARAERVIRESSSGSV